MCLQKRVEDPYNVNVNFNFFLSILIQLVVFSIMGTLILLNILTLGVFTPFL